jgi:hypothetical protein
MFEPKLLERAEIAARQMRYFRLFSQKGSFDELSASAQRAGFSATYEDPYRKKPAFTGILKAILTSHFSCLSLIQKP